MTANNKVTPAPRWDLDSIFNGGSQSAEFDNYRQKIKVELDRAEKALTDIPASIDDTSIDAWVKFILDLQSLYESIRLTAAFAECLVSQNGEDNKADAIVSEGHVLFSRWGKLRTGLEELSLKQSDQQWQKLVAEPRLTEIEFYLNELRTIAKKKMPFELESLALDLSVNGYHAWNMVYEKMAGELRVEFSENGQVSSVSVGQLATKMADPDRDIRKQAYEKLTHVWEQRADLAAMILNSQAGFRLSLYERRRWDPPVYEPLLISRMEKKTLDTMWEVIGREIKRLQPYIDAKKALLGIDKYRWYDEYAPCGKADKRYSFDEACQFICESVSPFSTEMADFFKMAAAKRWIEAEDRPGKRGGAYCTSFRPFKQPRIFMTFAGTYDGLMTLAHELGHAYHTWLMMEQPCFAVEYPMNLAETASTFVEAMVLDAALSRAIDPQEKLMLLEQKLQAAYTMFANLHCRYIFDTAFYEERKKGMVGKERLNEIMIDAQKKAFGSLLDESGLNPLFWCSKLHFFLTDTPFYNFPYTFGFLFSGGVYDRAKKEGPAFANEYKALLKSTGSMSTEQIALKHLGADLTKEDFWVSAVSRSVSDVDQFVKLANSLR